MKFSILGSCITRDIFRECSLDILVENYRARTSIHSITSQVAADISKLKLPESKFQQKMVISDFEKHCINTTDCDYLIIDLIDERFELITNFGSLVTLSNELRDSNNIKAISKYVERGTEEEYHLWRSAVKRFASEINVPVILHKSRLASKLNKANGNISVNTKYIDNLNQRMRRYEDIIYQEMNIFATINVDEKILISDVEHVWGYSPYHYIPEYYQEAKNQLFKICQIDSKVDLDKNEYVIQNSFDKEIIYSNLLTKSDNILIACYLFLDGELVKKEWYSEKRNYNFKFDKSKVNNFTTTFFIKNRYNEKLVIESETIELS
jgi:hypothetical protein